MKQIRKQEALDYHEQGRKGKLEIIPTKPHSSQRDLALAYSPGVAEPVLAIHANPEDVYRYTGKGNLVAIISNGTAILGLGNLGPEASKPVMEGKGMLFKIFADIDGIPRYSSTLLFTLPYNVTKLMSAMMLAPWSEVGLDVNDAVLAEPLPDTTTLLPTSSISMYIAIFFFF